MIVTVECPLCARCISEHFMYFNAFKPCVTYCAFVTATQLVSLEILNSTSLTSVTVGVSWEVDCEMEISMREVY